MARKYTQMRITHIDIYRLSLFMSGAKILLWCARALSLAHSGFSRSLSHSLGLTPRFIPRSLTRSLPPTLAHWFPYRVMYTLGLAPLPAGLGPGSAGWAAAPGGFVWLWVRGLGLSVSFLLRAAGFNLLGGLPPLLPGAQWPRVWPAVPVCDVLVCRLPGCAVACLGQSFRLGSAVPCCAALCRVPPRRAVACCALGCVVIVRCTVARCGAVCCAVSCCAVVGRWRLAWPVSWCGVRVGVWLAGGLGGEVRCGWLARSMLWGPGRAARAGGLRRCPWGCPPCGPVPWSRVPWGSRSLALGAVVVPSSSSGACVVALVAAGVVVWR